MGLKAAKLPKFIKSPFFWLPTLLVLIVGGTVLSQLDLIMKVPQLRVGPLVREVAAEQEVRFFALGDIGSGDENQHRVAAAMNARCESNGLDGMLFLGDHLYQGGFDSVNDPDWKKTIEDPYDLPCLKDKMIYAVLGNHDYKGNPTSQIEYSMKNERWYMPNRFYAVDFGFLVRVIAIDTNLSDFCFNEKFCSIDFLQAQSRNTKTFWTLTMAHHPLIASSEKGHGHSGGFRGTVLKSFICNDVDLWVAGHSHHLEYRSLPECGIEHFVSGGGGGDLYELDPEDRGYEFAKSTFGFLELVITREKVQATFIDADGQELYTRTINAPE